MTTDEIFAMLLDNRQYMTVVLPHPDKRLQPNEASGKHWGSTSAAKRAARTGAFYEAAQDHRCRYDWSGELILWIVIFPPDSGRAHDMKNTETALKASIDGIFDALRKWSASPNVTDHHITTSITQRGEKCPGGRVEITVIKSA